MPRGRLTSLSGFSVSQLVFLDHLLQFLVARHASAFAFSQLVIYYFFLLYSLRFSFRAPRPLTGEAFRPRATGCFG